MNIFKGQFKLPQVSDNIRPPSQQKPKSSKLKFAANNILNPSLKSQKQLEYDLPPFSAKSDKKIPNKENLKVLGNDKARDIIDETLINAMEKRLKEVQSICNVQRQQIKIQNKEIEKLEKFNKAYKSVEKGNTLQQIDNLIKKNNELENKLKDMQEYLKKYGLKWVGNKIQGKLNDIQLKKDIKKPKFDYRLPSQIDIQTMKRRCEDLNAGLHSQGFGTQIYIDNGVHKFRKAQPISIFFHKNGIHIKQFEFYPYKCQSSLKILSDLYDGYFPYLFKQKYPNGVFLSVVDCVEKPFIQEEGQKGIKISDGVQNINKPIQGNNRLNPRKPLKKIQSQKQLAQIKQAQFQQIDGRIIFQTQEQKRLEEQEIDEEQVCIIKTRTEDGKVCIIVLKKNQKMGKIYNLMSAVIKKPFKLMSNFPKRAFSKDQKETLEDLGLFPNALLHIHIIKQNPL